MSSSFRADMPSAIGLPNEAAASRRSRAWLWLLLPYALMLLGFLALPLANVLLLSVYRYSPIKIWIPEFTDANYIQMFTPYFGGVALRTASIGAIATLMCVLLGYPVAYYLSRCSKRALTVGMFILTLPLMV